MSKDDYDFGQKHLMSTVRFVTVLAGSSTQVVAASSKRVGLRFSSPPANRITLNPNGDAVLDAGLNVPPAVASGPQFCKKTTGNLCSMAWNGIAAVADQVIAVIETYRNDV